MPAAKNTIPNQNNLYAIFEANVTAVTSLNDVIVKAKISKKTKENIQQATEVIVESTKAIFDAVSKMSDFDPNKATNAMKALDATNRAINSMVNSINLIVNIRMAKVSSARRGVGKLNKFLFGNDKRRGRNMGLFSLFKKIGDNKNTKVITNASKNLRAIAAALKPFNRLLVILGISLMPVALSILTVKLMKIVIKVVLGIFRDVARNVKSVHRAAKLMRLIISALSLFTLGLLLIGISFVIGWPLIGVAVLGILGILGLMMLISFSAKFIKHGTRVILRIAMAVAILGMVAITMALLGQYIEMNWEGFLTVAAYMALLVGVFLALAVFSKFINKGIREFAYISLAVAMLGMTAILMSLLGRYITMNWQGFLQVSLYMVVLVGMFMAVGAASKWINKGGKEFFFIAATVGIIAGIAIVLVIAGNYVKSNWEGILSISLMMTVLTGVIIGVGFAAKQINRSKAAFSMVLAAAVIMAGIATVFVEIANKLDGVGGVAKMAAIIVMISLMILGIAALAITLGMLTETGVGAAALWAGIAAVAAIAGMIAVLALAVGGAIAMIADATKKISEIKGKPSELIAKMMLPIELVMSLVGMIIAIPPFIIGLAAVRIGAMAMIMNCVGQMADTLQHIASLNMPIEWDAKGKPTKFQSMNGQDFSNAAMNAAGILGVAVGMFDDSGETLRYKFADGSEAEVKGISLSALNNITGSAKRRIKKLTKIVGYIGNMADTLQHIASMNIPIAWDENGKPKDYKNMDGGDFRDAAMNAGGILKFFVALFDDKSENGTTIEFSNTEATIKGISATSLDAITGTTKRKVKKLNNIVSAIGNMAGTLRDVAAMNIPVAWGEDGKPKDYKDMDGNDFKNAALNSAGILKFFVALFHDNPEDIPLAQGVTVTVKALEMSHLDNIKGKTKRKIEKLGYIVSTIGGMAETLQKMASLTVPDTKSSDDFTENGTPKKWKKLDSDAIKESATNAGSLVKFFAALFDDKNTTLPFGGVNTEVKPITTTELDNIKKKNKKKIQMLGDIVGSVGNMATVIQSLASMSVPDPKQGFNPDGTPRGWRAFYYKDIISATDTAGYILKSICGILGGDDVMSFVKDMKKRNLEKLGMAMDSISGLSSTVDLCKALGGGEIPTGYKTDNNPDSPTYGCQIPTGYFNLKDFINEKEGSIKDAIKKIILMPCRCIYDLIENDKTAASFIEDGRKYGWMINDLNNELFVPLVKMLDFYNQIAHVDVDRAVPALTGLVYSAVYPLEKVTEKGDPDKMFKAAEAYAIVVAGLAGGQVANRKFAGIAGVTDKNSQNFSNNVKEVTALMKQINSTDVNKLKYASTIMEKMAQFSNSIKGNFKELSKTLSQDLIVVLEKLQKTLESLKEHDFGGGGGGSHIGDSEEEPTGTPRMAKTDSKTANNYSDNLLDLINEIADDINAIRKKSILGDNRDGRNFTGINRNY